MFAVWKIVHSGSGFGGVVLPSACDGQNPNPPENADPNDPTTMMCKSRNYVILSDQSMYIDQQPLKLQESPEVSKPWLRPAQCETSAEPPRFVAVCPWLNRWCRRVRCLAASLCRVSATSSTR